MKLMPDRRRIGTNLIIFMIPIYKKMEEQKTKFVIPAPIISASSIFNVI